MVTKMTRYETFPRSKSERYSLQTAYVNQTNVDFHYNFCHRLV
jgi:hypothetical protein